MKSSELRNRCHMLPVALLNCLVMSKVCTVCGKRAYSDYCVTHKPRKAIISKKRPRQQSDKEKEYQVWKETVARPALIGRDGNYCSCCGRPPYSDIQHDEHFDIDHIKNKGSHVALKRDLANLQLLCRWPCHSLKTDGKSCLH